MPSHKLIRLLRVWAGRSGGSTVLVLVVTNILRNPRKSKAENKKIKLKIKKHNN